MSVQSVNIQSIESAQQLLKEHEQKVAELKKLLRTMAKSSAKKGAEQGAEEGAEVKASKGPSAWNILVTETVADMKQSGWQSWTDAGGASWPASRSATVKDKSGSERSAFVFDGGEYDGKEPSPALGGMKRASYLKAQSNPVAAQPKARVAKPKEAKPEAQAEAPVPAEAEVVAEAQPSATQKCISCKHEVALSSFQKSMTSTGAVRQLKCCAECRVKQSKRNAVNNPINNEKAKEARKAKKAAERESLASMSDGMPEGWAELLGSKVVTE
jgi:hypothetical protein